MTIADASSTACEGAAAHLEAAWFLAAEAAWIDGDGLMSTWADTSHAVAMALAALRPYLTGPLPLVEHQECRSALQAAAVALAQLQPGVDLPTEELVLLVELLSPALRHV